MIPDEAQLTLQQSAKLEKGDFSKTANGGNKAEVVESDDEEIDLKQLKSGELDG